MFKNDKYCYKLWPHSLRVQTTRLHVFEEMKTLKPE